MKYIAVLIAVLSTFDSFALDAHWNESESSNRVWVMPKNWTNELGEVVAVPPTNRADNAYLTPFAKGYNQGNYVIDFGFVGTSKTPEWGGSCYFVEFNRVISPDWYHLRLGTENGVKFSPEAKLSVCQTVSVADPDGFAGLWTSANGRGEIEVRATADHSPKLSHVDTFGMMSVKVPDAGTSASVESLVRNGALVKSGDGNLTVDYGAGWDSRIYVRGGSVTLTGRPDDGRHLSPKAPVPGAYLHLDASKDTFSTFKDEEGRTCIGEWRDCDGGPVSAITNDFRGTANHQIKTSHAPYLSGKTSPSGLRLVDFGRLFSEVGDSGAASNCWLKLTRTCNEVREIFYAASCQGTGNYLTLFGYAGSEIYDLGGGGASYVFSTVASASAKRAEAYFNGFRCASTGSPSVSRYGSKPSDFSVVSAGMDAPQRFNAIASDRNYSYYTGGWLVGEILVYTNALTREERILVNRYLMDKWQKGYRDDDVGEVVLVADATAVSVPSGRVARVRQLSTMGSKIVKTGEGALIVDGLAPAGVPVEIRGGTVRVAAPDTSAAALPADPYFHVDASLSGTLVHSNDAQGVATKYVTRWNDCEGGTVFAEVPVAPVEGETNVYFTDPAFTGHLPWVEEKDSPTGLATVNFGNGTSNFSFMQLQPHGVAKVYSGFIVAKRNSAGLGGIDWFGSTSADMLCHSGGHLLQDLHSKPESRMASWTIDGRTLDPNVESSIGLNTAYHVVSFSATVPRLCDLLAKYTLVQDGQGGCLRIGEVVLYDRLLSAAERRDAEAFLMRKWLGKEHPESQVAFHGSYSFPDGEDKVIDTDASGTVTNLVGGTGAIVKRGAGAVRIDDPGHESGFTSLTAEEGALTLRFGFRDDAAIRFDASDTASFTKTYETEEGGQTVTNLLWWQDSVGGKVAHSAHENGFSYKYAQDSASSTTNPVLTTVEMRPGVWRPAVDFHERLNVRNDVYGKDPDGKDASTVNPETGLPYAYEKNPRKSAGFQFETYGDTSLYKVKEVHAVHMDTTVKSGRIFGQRNSDLDFERSGGAFLSTSYSAKVLAGSTYCNAEAVETPAATKVPDGFNVISHQIPDGVPVSAISMDRNCNSGGTMTSEYVGYATAHTPEVCQYIDRMLMHKWLGEARPVWTRAFDSLVAAKDATLTVDCDPHEAVSAATLGGAGTISATELHDVAALELVSPETCLTVQGDVVFADEGTVSFETVAAHLTPGEYVVFAADRIANPEVVDAWTLSNVNLPSSRIFTLRCVGNTLVLKVEKRGSLLIVR